MDVVRIETMVDGWLIGNFDPAILKTDKFEVGVKKHKKGALYPIHLHKESTEFNYLISGIMKIHDKMLTSGDIFIIKPWEISDPVFIEDCVVLVIRDRSNPKDKYEYLPKDGG